MPQLMKPKSAFGSAQPGLLDDPRLTQDQRLAIQKMNGLVAEQAPISGMEEEAADINAQEEIDQALQDSAKDDAARAVQSAFESGDSTEGQLKKNYELRKMGVAAAAEAGAKQAAQEASAFEQQRKMAEEQSRKLEETQRLRSEEILAQEEKYRSLADEASKAAVSADPNRLWKNYSTGQKILAAISIGLGEMGKAYGAGQNAGLQIINDAIEKDYLAQKEAAAGKRMAADAQSNLLSMVKQRYDDEISQKKAFYAMALEAPKARLEQIAATARSDEVKAKALEAYGALGNEQLKAKAELDKLQAESASKRLEGNEKYVPGVGYLSSKEEASEAKKLNEATANTLESLQKIKALREKYGTEYLNRSAVAEGKALATDLQLQGKELYKLGVLSGSDAAMLERLIPTDPLEQGFDSTIMAQLDTAQKIIDSKIKNYYLTRTGKSMNPVSAPSSKEIDDKMVALAKQNPDQPWAKAILKLNQ